jgi:hypothetical protein
MRNTVARSATARDSVYPSLLKAFRILDAFSEHETEWRVTDLARMTTTSKSTASRLLTVMCCAARR